MGGSEESPADEAPERLRLGLIAYVLAWLGGAAVIVALLLVLLDGADVDGVTVPPVREIQLAKAAREAGCELRRPRAGQRLNPPVEGATGVTPASPGIYEDAPDAASLVAALRDGTVVIQFRALDSAGVELLEAVQEAVPDGTILAPNATGMPFVVAVTAYRRMLGCRDLSDASIDAIQLFRGRFVGSGPDV